MWRKVYHNNSRLKLLVAPLSGAKSQRPAKAERSGILLFAKRHKFSRESARPDSLLTRRPTRNNATYAWRRKGCARRRGSFSLQALWPTCSSDCGRRVRGPQQCASGRFVSHCLRPHRGKFSERMQGGNYLGGCSALCGCCTRANRSVHIFRLI